MMLSLSIPINPPFLGSSSSCDPNYTKSCFLSHRIRSSSSSKSGSPYKNGFQTKFSGDSWALLVVGFERDRILMRKGGKERLTVVRANGGFGFNGGDGGGGGWDKDNTTRVLGNLAFAAGLTYLSVTGQLGWVLDAIVSIWLLAVLLPIVGFGAFFWYAGRDIVQSSCPNCGNDFQILKSSMKDGVQLCPFCTQPFSVQDNKFVREAAKFSSGRSTRSGQVFSGFSRSTDKGKTSSTTSSTTIVDVEAEVKDIE